MFPVCFGLILVKNRIKWWLLGTIVLTMLLSFGKNWPLFTDLFFNYFPMFNKFRAVESILAVAGLCFPILAFYAVSEVIAAKDKAPILKKLMLALYITGGLTLLLVIMPDLFLSFKGGGDQSAIAQLTQAFDTGTANSFIAALVQDRVSLARADAFRSLIFVLLTFGALYLFIKQKINVTMISVTMLVLVLADMWLVDKRYIKDENFVDKEDMQQPKPRAVDNFILGDRDPDFRVFDMSSGDPFTDANTSFFHKIHRRLPCSQA